MLKFKKPEGGKSFNFEIVNEDNDNFDTFLRNQHGICVGGARRNDLAIKSVRYVYDIKTQTMWYPETGVTVSLKNQPNITTVSTFRDQLDQESTERKLLAQQEALKTNMLAQFTVPE